MGSEIRVRPERIRLLQKGIAGRGPVFYWMSRDQRARDNWALLYASNLAKQARVPLFVVFCLTAGFVNAARCHYRFMLQGLRETEFDLSEHNIPFLLVRGDPADRLSLLLEEHGARLLVSDFDPLKIKLHWKERLLARLRCPVYEVDAHNVVPCFAASDRQEFGAHTLRLKLRRLLPLFLEDFPSLPRQRFKVSGSTDWENLLASFPGENPERHLNEPVAGSRNAERRLANFLSAKIAVYASLKNEPSLDFTSGLSPYLHFGQIGGQRVALEALRNGEWPEFLDELITRRELCDNYCFFNGSYDSIAGLPAWSRKTLDLHRQDRREYLYSLGELEAAVTHDEIWNAAQLEMVLSGRMHGYMRMYWAKKILEWSPSPEEALAAAILLNDRYELDGRDPNGYAGCAWAIGGLHDRPFSERPVFGKVRYMNAAGLKRKFNIAAYLEKVARLREAVKPADGSGVVAGDSATTSGDEM